MGDRGNIEIKQPGADDSLFLYTHWRGSSVCEILADALAKGGRWSDPSYLTRIIFQEMIGDDDTTTGFGISVGNIEDNEHTVPLVSWTGSGTGGGPTITLDDVTYTPQEFITRYAGVVAKLNSLITVE